VDVKGVVVALAGPVDEEEELEDGPGEVTLMLIILLPPPRSVEGRIGLGFGGESSGTTRSGCCGSCNLGGPATFSMDLP